MESGKEDTIDVVVVRSRSRNPSTKSQEPVDITKSQESTDMIKKQEEITKTQEADTLKTEGKPSRSRSRKTPIAVPDAPASPPAPRQRKPEPLLVPNPRRHVLFPIEHHDVFDMYKKHQSSLWHVGELDLAKDLKDWEETLSDGERHFITHVLAFFAASDGIVMENLALRFSNEVQWPEARQFYAVQMYMEAVHSETYSHLIQTYIKNTKEREHVLSAVQTIPCIGKKAEWAMSWIENREVDFATRLIAFAIVEGIFFSGAFCAIYWLKERNLMQGLCVSNEWIARDEGLHTMFACLLYSHITKRVSKTTVYKMFREALKIEKEFIIDSLPCSLIGMNSKMMSEYLEFVADRLLLQLGYPKLFEANNPFAFMDRIGLQGKGNFFERRETSYSKAKITNTTTVLQTTDDF